MKNRLHLDLRISGGRDVPLETREQRVDAKAERLAALGGTVLRVTDAPEAGSYYIVMQDPEGDEFCVT
jgi:predicted enzyme related to lactoylglutathione lyase